MAKHRVQLSMSGEDVAANPPRAEVTVGDTVEFWTDEQNWSMSVDFEGSGSASLAETAFYVDPGVPKVLEIGSELSGILTYLVRATEKGPKEPVAKSKTADIEVRDLEPM